MLGTVVDTIQGRPVYAVAEQQPEYPGGLNQFLARSLRYPAAHLRDQVEGKVFVSFIVDRQGYVRRPGIVKHLTDPCDAEALRVVGLLERFEPGRRDGQPVDVRFVLPLDFTIRTGAELRRYRRASRRALAGYQRR